MTTRNTRSKTSAGTGWRIIEGGITAPQGYLASGVSAGIKKKGLDLAVVFSSQTASAAGVFTLNRVQAAPVVLSKENLKLSRGRIRAILINSGCANACTGERGMHDSVLSTQCLASHLNIDPSQVLVASTGVIGSFLPVPKVLKGISSAVSALNSHGGGAAAARHHDHRYAGKVDRRRRAHRRKNSAHRRHGQRVRNDPSANGDHDRRHYDGCAGGSPAN